MFWFLKWKRLSNFVLVRGLEVVIIVIIGSKNYCKLEKSFTYFGLLAFNLNADRGVCHVGLSSHSFVFYLNVSSSYRYILFDGSKVGTRDAAELGKSKDNLHYEQLLGQFTVVSIRPIFTISRIREIDGSI